MIHQPPSRLVHAIVGLRADRLGRGARTPRVAWTKPPGWRRTVDERLAARRTARVARRRMPDLSGISGCQRCEASVGRRRGGSADAGGEAGRWLPDEEAGRWLPEARRVGGCRRRGGSAGAGGVAGRRVPEARRVGECRRRGGSADARREAGRRMPDGRRVGDTGCEDVNQRLTMTPHPSSRWSRRPWDSAPTVSAAADGLPRSHGPSQQVGGAWLTNG